MKVESAGAERTAPSRRLRKRSWVLPLAAAALLTGLVGFAGLRSESWQQRLQEASGAVSREQAVRAALAVPARFARATLSRERAPELQLDIKFKHLHKLHQKRDAALEAGLLVGSPEDFVPATVKTGALSSRVEIRLVGGDTEHLRGQKWSLRVHVKGRGHVFGMRRFSLLAPELRGFQAESLFLEHLRREDVLVPRYLFVETVFNGKHLGLMALEESFSAELLESQQRRDGVILHLVVPKGGYEPAGTAPRSTRGVEILPSRARRIADSKKLSRNLEIASRRLRDFLGGALEARVVFDVEAMGRFLAVVETWGALNALEWSNLRFYFNPLTASFEPIGFAGELQRTSVASARGVRDMPFGALMLESPDVRGVYLAALRRSRVALNAHGSDSILASEERWLRILHREYPLRSAFHEATAAERDERLVRTLNQFDERRLSANPDADSDIRGAMSTAIIPADSIEENLARHRFLRWNPEANEFSVAPGQWSVDGSIHLPQGAGLRVPAGVVLSFEADKGLVARGPLHFEGSADAPIVLEGPPSSRRKKLWSGVYVLESAAPSRWSYVRVRNTGGFKRRGWQLPGGVVFRKTHVDFEHCRFTDNRSDDSLNLIRSSFSMKDVSIRASESDALDLDYSSGTIEGGFIEVAGGDGIDLGGSQLELQGAQLRELSDKAIVVGERSRLVASGIMVEAADIGLASKNGSRAELRDSELRDIDRVALLAYSNRSEFGPGVIVADGNRVRGAARLSLSERDSEIVIDGERIVGENISIASLEDLAGSDR